MYFWLKFLHISAMAVWFAGLFFLPRLLIARAQHRLDGKYWRGGRMGKALYFGLMTPGAAVTIVLGIVLLAWGFEGAWLPAKLCLVALAVLLHVYFGQLLMDPDTARSRHTLVFYRVLNWLPLLVLLAIAALAAAKPMVLPVFGGI